MKIEDLRSSAVDGRKRISATITWEDTERPPQEIFFETDDEFGADLSCNPHTFLVSSLMPAFKAGEKRIAIDEEICPELRAGLKTAMKWIRQWYYDPERSLVKIESKAEQSTGAGESRNRTAFFFSGGIDSLATLRANRLNIPADHPRSIKDGILVYGLEVYEPGSFAHVTRALAKIAADAGIDMISVYTNVRELDLDWHFWEYQWEGAVFSSIAHALIRRIGNVCIAATHDTTSLMPLGSHPLLDPLYGSCTLRVLHDGILLSRFERTKLIADWDVGRENLRVCNQSEQYSAESLNCGACEKCVRTMLAFSALGVLEDTKAFSKNEVSVDTIAGIRWIAPSSRPFYKELIGPLTERGYEDLAAAIEHKLRQYDPTPETRKGKTLIYDAIRRADGKYLSGRLRQLKRKLAG